MVVLLLPLIAAFGWWLWRRPVVTVETALGGSERCQTCHRGGQRGGRAHPAVSGHPELGRYGCVSCHGGDASATRRSEAHAAARGAAFGVLPVAYAQSGCLQCHSPGAVSGTERLLAGRNEYVAAKCIACHQPGRMTTGVGIDLRQHTVRDPERLHRLLLEPKAVIAGATMWSLRDVTYRDRYADSEAGNQRITELMIYVLGLARSPKAYRQAWHGATVKVNAPCATCHAKGARRGRGEPHRCLALRNNPQLRCQTCHAGDRTVDKNLRKTESAERCPQVEAQRPLCATCHLRDEGQSARARVQAR